VSAGSVRRSALLLRLQLISVRTWLLSSLDLASTNNDNRITQAVTGRLIMPGVAVTRKDLTTYAVKAHRQPVKPTLTA